MQADDLEYIRNPRPKPLVPYQNYDRSWEGIHIYPRMRPALPPPLPSSPPEILSPRERRIRTTIFIIFALWLIAALVFVGLNVSDSAWNAALAARDSGNASPPISPWFLALLVIIPLMFTKQFWVIGFGFLFVAILSGFLLAWGCPWLLVVAVAIFIGCGVVAAAFTPKESKCDSCGSRKCNSCGSHRN